MSAEHRTHVAEAFRTGGGVDFTPVCVCGWAGLPTRARGLHDVNAIEQAKRRCRDHLRWAEAQADRRCLTCDGTGDREDSPDITCRDCNGTGIAPDMEDQA